MIEEDEKSSLGRDTPLDRTDHHSPIEHPMAHHLSSADENDVGEEEEHFLIALLNDAVWMEEPVPDRHVSIHEDSQHHLCLYPCPYSLDQLHLNYIPQHMDLSDISDFQDVKTTASDEDIPNLEDVLQL